jgi:aryl-alcohol dehydrogenase-like predicted oxidoreductase
MQMRVFGRTGMQLSVLGFGCGAVGTGRSCRPGAYHRAGNRPFTMYALCQDRASRRKPTSSDAIGLGRTFANS